MNPSKFNISVKEAFSFTQRVSQDFPGRITGSLSCLFTSKKIQEELEKHCDHGTVKMEEFTCHPQAFLKYIPFLVVLYLLSSLLLFFRFPIWGFLGFALGNFVFYGQFVQYYQILDPLFPKKKGFNVLGVIEPSEKPQRQIIISAHHDSAYVFQFLSKFPKIYPFLLLGGIGFLFLGFLISLTFLILQARGIPLPQWPSIILFCGSIFVFPFLFFTTNEVSPGCGDDLIAVGIILQVAGVFKEEKNLGKPLSSTRLVFVSFDGEEAGLRGSRAFIKFHLEELKSLPTEVLNIDTIYQLDHLSFFSRDLNSFVPLSRELAEELVSLAKSLGYTGKVSAMTFGGGATDAASFGKIGIPATNICAMSFNIHDYKNGFPYHTPKDSVENIEPEAVEAIIEIIVNFIQKRDRVGERKETGGLHGKGIEPQRGSAFSGG